MRAEKALIKVKNSMDRASLLYNGGLEERLAKANLAIARRMKNAGRPLSEIEEFTGLPPDTIEKL